MSHLTQQSFHLVQPQIALKIATALSPGGRLALLSSPITPTSPTRHDLEKIYADYLHVTQRPIVDAVHNDELIAIGEDGFTAERRRFVELHDSTNDWLNVVFTYSSHLTLSVRCQRIWHSAVDHLAPWGLGAASQ